VIQQEWFSNTESLFLQLEITHDEKDAKNDELYGPTLEKVRRDATRMGRLVLADEKPHGAP
jgi:hypothetical protein